jgi:hypothetical protein
MATSVVSSPVRSAGTAGSPGFRSQRKMSAGTIVKKIQTLEGAIESLRQQLVFARSEQDEDVCLGPQKEVKKPKEIKQQKETKETKQKKTQESKEEEKDKIPMPWIGQADFTTCVGLKAQYGLFIQCAKTCDMKTASFQIDNHECRFCSDCSKKCDENGKHSVGTIEERIEAGVGKYVNVKTGKKETMYIEVLEKMGITKEQALESAQRRGFQIPDWMLEKAEKKRGRPAATVAAATVAPTALAINTGNDETKTNETKDTKEKKPRQPRAKATTKAATTKAATTKAATTKAATTKTTTKKTAKAIIATQDTPQKKNSAQSSICIDLNQNVDDESVTPVADADVADAASIADASVASSIPQENEKKKRGRPTKSNTQNNIGESEMQQLIAQATTEKKKRLSLDAAADTHTSEEGDQTHVETHLTFEENGNEQEQLGEDEIFEMFDKMLENENEDENEDEKNQQEKQQEQVVTVATKEKKGKSEKKAKKSDDNEKVEKEKISKKEAALKKAEEEAALKKAQEEEAAKKKAQEEEDGEETEDEEEDESNEEEDELECEEYEYDGETYGLAPNGDIYSQDGDLVGKLTNGVPNMFN